MSRKSLRNVVLSVSALALLGLGTAYAGEVNGRGDPIPGGVNGRSECSFSGQQDDPVADEGFFRGDRVQSWGQIPKAFRDFLRSLGVYPGVSCNPNKA